MSTPASRLSREEQARIEIGHTDISRPLAWFLTVVFLAVIFGAPLLQHLFAWADAHAGRGLDRVSFYKEFRGVGGEMREAWWKAGTRLDRFLDPNAALLRRMVAFQDSLDNRFLLTTLTRTPVQSILCHLGVGNEKAIVGRDGWLFYEPDVAYVTGPGFLDPRQIRRRSLATNERGEPLQPDPVRAIVHFRDQLKSRGIELVVMPAPVKPSIHPEGLSTGSFGRSDPVQNVSYGPFIASLQDHGIRIFDCAPILRRLSLEAGPAYLRTDTHWRPDAMQAVADELTTFIRSSVSLPAAPSMQYPTTPCTVQSQGDIAVMLKLPAGQTLFPAEQVTVHQVRTRDGQLWTPDPVADVLLLGDSFANIYSLRDMNWGEGAGLTEQLSRALDRPVDRLIQNDRGAYATRAMLAQELARGSDRLKGKRLVIWEFAARELAGGDWRNIELKIPSITASNIVSASATDASGLVAEVSTRPKQNALYRDYIMKLHVRNLVGRDGQPVGGGDAVVYLFGMRQGTILPVADIQKGAPVRLRLRPWPEVEKQYGSLKAGELGDISLEIDRPIYWAEVQ